MAKNGTVLCMLTIFLIKFHLIHSTRSWENNFEKNKERSWEWTVSGPPASEKSREWVNTVFKAIELKLAVCPLSDQMLKCIHLHALLHIGCCREGLEHFFQE